MKKIIVLLVAMMSILGGMSTVPANAAMDKPGVHTNTVNPGGGGGKGYNCRLRVRGDYVKKRVNMPLHHTYYTIKSVQKFWLCKGKGHRTYSLPRSTTVSYDRKGKHMLCNAWVWVGPVLHKMRTHTVFVDSFGHKMPTADLNVPCDKDTKNSRTRYYKNPKKMYWDGVAGGNHPPHWTTWYTLLYYNAPTEPDPHGSVGVALAPNN